MTPSRRLILLRHAKSAWPIGVTDTDRPLNERGRATAPRMGAYLAAEGLVPDRVMVSPARRTRETWERLRGALPEIEPEIVPMIYEASAQRILDAICSAPDHAGTLLVIGHNPGFQDLAMMLVGSGSTTARARLGEKFPTAGLAVIDFAATSWGAVGRGRRAVGALRGAEEPGGGCGAVKHRQPYAVDSVGVRVNPAFAPPLC